MTHLDAVERGAVEDVLAAVANDLAGEFRLRPLLERILRSAVELLGCRSGSLCLIDRAAQTYRKEIDLEEGCQTGTVFPLDEGCTGAVAKAVRPVIFERYSQIGKGHIEPDEPRFHRGVIGVPIVLGSDLIGSCIVFAATDERRFEEADARLLQRFATHAAIAIANSRLHEAASLRDKAAAVAAERERAMLEVQNSIGRGLAGIAGHISQAHAASSRGDDPLPALYQAQLATQQTMNEGRRAVWGLGPAGLAGRPIQESISLELEWLEAISDLTSTLRVFGEPQPLSQTVALQVVRIVQESLTNVAQHAQASMVRIGLVHGPTGLALIIEDDGCGFDPEAAVGRGVGLPGLVARAAQVGGRVRIDSTRGWGTRIRADLPYQEVLGSDADPPRLRAVVIHQSPAMRAGLVELVGSSEPGVQVVAEVAEPAAGAEAVRLLQPEVILSGTMLTGTSATAFLAALRDCAPTASVVAVIDPGTTETELREWATAGVGGFVPAEVDATTLGRVVIGVARGDVLVVGEILAQLGGPPVVDPDRLTDRERQVRTLIGEGLADKQIAARLGISAKTVEKHVGAVLRKLGVHSRTVLLARG